MSQDINHRHELDTLTDDLLIRRIKYCENSIKGSTIVARKYYTERLNMGRLILKERKEKRMYLATISK